MNASPAPILHDAENRKFYTEGGACLLYSRKSDVLSIDHVFVPDPLRGQRLASRLVKQAVAYADSIHAKVRPVCSYARSFLERTIELHPSLATEFRSRAVADDNSQST